MTPVFPDDLVLVPVSRNPTVLADDTVNRVLATPLERTVPAFRPDPGIAPRASIVVVTHNALVFTRLCLESLLAAPSTAHDEVIVVDNASTDGSGAYLTALAARDGRVRVESLDRNRGFAAATNCGVALSRGDVLVLLNNDTIVPGDSLERLIAHLSDPQIGVAGAVTNRAGNEAEIDASYRTSGDLDRFADRHGRSHRGESFDIRTATMFCVALRRSVWDGVGPLDERFEVGLFEDDDYSMRVRQAGYRVVCAEDAFVHHFGQASIGQLAATGDFGALFHANRARWEAKWGGAWQPYARREKPAYQALVTRIRDLVCEAVPPQTTLAVISKGDADLVRFEGRRAWHFPQGADETYAGHYPADSAACIAELERQRAQGASVLVIPATASWWLDHYGDFRGYLESRYRAMLVTDDCRLFDLQWAGHAER